jgi:hypothetical protein
VGFNFQFLQLLKFIKNKKKIKIFPGDPPKDARPMANRPRKSINNFLPPVANILRCMCIGISDNTPDTPKTPKTPRPRTTSNAAAADAGGTEFDFSPSQLSIHQRTNTLRQAPSAISNSFWFLFIESIFSNISF